MYVAIACILALFTQITYANTPAPQVGSLSIGGYVYTQGKQSISVFKADDPRIKHKIKVGTNPHMPVVAGTKLVIADQDGFKLYSTEMQQIVHAKRMKHADAFMQPVTDGVYLYVVSKLGKLYVFDAFSFNKEMMLKLEKQPSSIKLLAANTLEVRFIDDTIRIVNLALLAHWASYHATAPDGVYFRLSAPNDMRAANVVEFVKHKEGSFDQKEDEVLSAIEVEGYVSGPILYHKGYIYVVQTVLGAQKRYLMIIDAKQRAIIKRVELAHPCNPLLQLMHNDVVLLPGMQYAPQGEKPKWNGIQVYDTAQDPHQDVVLTSIDFDISHGFHAYSPTEHKEGVFVSKPLKDSQKRLLHIYHPETKTVNSVDMGDGILKMRTYGGLVYILHLDTAALTIYNQETGDFLKAFDLPKESNSFEVRNGYVLVTNKKDRTLTAYHALTFKVLKRWELVKVPASVTLNFYGVAFIEFTTKEEPSLTIISVESELKHLR